jgi:hypothetical protein
VLASQKARNAEWLAHLKLEKELQKKKAEEARLLKLQKQKERAEKLKELQEQKRLKREAERALKGEGDQQQEVPEEVTE